MSKSALKTKEYLSVTYSKERAPYGQYPSQFSDYLVKNYFNKRGKLLDLGCGRGEYLKALSDLNLKTYGVDISPKLSEYSRENNLNMIVADLEASTLPFKKESFDYVFSKSVIEHLREPAHLIQNAHDVLKPGGKAVFMTPSWEHNYKAAFYIDHTHVTPFTKPSLSDIIKMCGFDNVEVQYFYQIPWLWGKPYLNFIPKVISLLPIPYRPLNDVPWKVSNKFNKLIRFSKEVMLLAVATKKE